MSKTIIKKEMFIYAYNMASGDLVWKTSRNISSFYTSYDLSPVFYNENLLLPLDDIIESIRVENGLFSWEYANDDIEHIYLFDENSIQNNTMTFFIEDIDIEYVVVDLDKNIKIGGGNNISNPENGAWVNGLFVDVSPSGPVTAYGLSLNGIDKISTLWENNYNTTLRLVGGDENKLSFLDLDNKQIIVVASNSGDILKITPLLWPAKNIEILNNYFLVKSTSKLYLISI